MHQENNTVATKNFNKLNKYEEQNKLFMQLRELGIEENKENVLLLEYLKAGFNLRQSKELYMASSKYSKIDCTFDELMNTINNI